METFDVLGLCNSGIESNQSLSSLSSSFQPPPSIYLDCNVYVDFRNLLRWPSRIQSHRIVSSWKPRYKSFERVFFCSSVTVQTPFKERLATTP